MKTEKRYAKVGEQIVITRAFATAGRYKDGDVFRVIQTEGPRPSMIGATLREGDVMVDGHSIFIDPQEYEVITEEDEPNADSNEA